MSPVTNSTCLATLQTVPHLLSLLNQSLDTNEQLTVILCLETLIGQNGNLINREVKNFISFSLMQRVINNS